MAGEAQLPPLHVTQCFGAGFAPPAFLVLGTPVGVGATELSSPGPVWVWGCLGVDNQLTSWPSLLGLWVWILSPSTS